MPKLPGVPHLAAIRALKRAGFRIVRQGKHVVASDGRRILTISHQDGARAQANLPARQGGAPFLLS
jgi:predicted RNA binding protein YcfA (HicA-like mRNA interferase family)